MSGPQVTVGFADAALTVLVTDAARRVDGVVRLQRRPMARTVSRVGAVVRGRERTTPDGLSADASAVEVTRTAAGALEVSVRIVSSLQPRPVQVVAAVGDAVRARLAEIGERGVRIEVTVTDVQG